MDYVLHIEPDELIFSLRPGEQSSLTCSLTNTYHAPISYKVRTAQPRRYCVQLNKDIIQPGETKQVRFIQKAYSTLPDDFPACRDKFQLLVAKLDRPQYQGMQLEDIWKSDVRPDFERKFKVQLRLQEDLLPREALTNTPPPSKSPENNAKPLTTFSISKLPPLAPELPSLPSALFDQEQLTGQLSIIPSDTPVSPTETEVLHSHPPAVSVVPRLLPTPETLDLLPDAPAESVIPPSRAELSSIVSPAIESVNNASPTYDSTKRAISFSANDDSGVTKRFEARNLPESVVVEPEVETAGAAAAAASARFREIGHRTGSESQLNREARRLDDDFNSAMEQGKLVATEKTDEYVKAEEMRLLKAERKPIEVDVNGEELVKAEGAGKAERQQKIEELHDSDEAAGHSQQVRTAETKDSSRVEEEQILAADGVAALGQTFKTGTAVPTVKLSSTTADKSSRSTVENVQNVQTRVLEEVEVKHLELESEARRNAEVERQKLEEARRREDERRAAEQRRKDEEIRRIAEEKNAAEKQRKNEEKRRREEESRAIEIERYRVQTRERVIRACAAPTIDVAKMNETQEQRAAVDRSCALYRMILQREKQIEELRSELIEARHKLSNARVGVRPMYDVVYEVDEDARISYFQLVLMVLVSGAILPFFL